MSLFTEDPAAASEKCPNLRPLVSDRIEVFHTVGPLVGSLAAYYKGMSGGES